MIVKKATVALMVCAMFAMPMGTVFGQMEQVDGEAGMPMMEMWWPEPGDFEYENGTVSGNYLNFGLDETTGAVTDYTVTVSTANMMYPLMLYQENVYAGEDGELFIEERFPEFNRTTENVTVFDSIEIEDFTPAGQPGTFADMLIFQGEDVLMMFYDSDFAFGSYISDDDNVTLTFQVSDGFEVSRFPYYYHYMQDTEDWDYGDEVPSDPDDGPGYDEGWDSDMEYPEDPYWMPYSWDEVWIEGKNTTTSIWVLNGQATIEDNIVTVELGPNGRIDFNTMAEMPYFDYCMDPWFDDMEYEEDRGIIESAIEDGVLAAVGYLFAEEGEMQWSDANYYEDPTFSMEFTDIEDDWVEIEVDSRIPEGRIVSVNLNQNALDISNLDDILVKLDDAKIKGYDTLEELTELIGGPDAGYYVLFGESGNTVFVYVPHFSTHTITLESVLGMSANILVPAILAVAFIAATVSVVVLRGRKGQDEY